MNRAALLGTAFALLATIISACGGGGGSTNVPAAGAPTGTSGFSTSSTTPATSTLQIKLLLDSSPTSTSSKRRSPQYINPQADEVVVVTDNGGVTSNQTISLTTVESYNSAFVATPAEPCEYLYTNTPIVRSCTIFVNVSAGTNQTFYVLAVCGPQCNADEESPFVLGAGVAPNVTVPGTSSVSVTMSPLIVANVNTLSFPAPPSNVQIGTCSSPCSESVTFDGDPPSPAPTSLGELAITAYDASGAQVPAMKVDSNLADWTASFTNGVGYMVTPPTVSNMDAFIVNVPTPPATAPSAVPITLGAVNQNTTDTLQHVTIESSAGCSSPFSMTLSNAYVLNSATPFVCYDEQATFNGDAPAYYATVEAIGGTPVVPCSGSACPPILETFYYTPMFVNLDSTNPTSDCNLGDGGYAACIQVSEYGFNGSSVVQASTSAGPSATSPPGCDSGFAIQAFATEGSTYTASAPSAIGTPLPGNTSKGGIVSSGVDSNGYAEFGFTVPQSGTCTVTFQFYTGGYPSGPEISRTYSSTNGSGTITTIFGGTRRPASLRR